MITKRKLLLGTAATAGLAALHARRAFAQAKTLRVATYGGSWLEAVKAHIEPRFKEGTGGTVEYIVGGPRESLGKLVAARGQNVPFDIVEWPDDIQAEAVKQGLVESIDRSKVPNVANLQAQAELRKGYSPAASWVVSGLIYNGAKLKEAGIATPAGYDALTDPKLAGHVALPDIRNPVAVAFLAGLNKHLSGNELEIDKSLTFLQNVKDPISYPNFAVLQSRFSAGDIWVVPGNLAYVVRLKSATPETGFVRPPIGDRRAVAQANIVDIVKGTPNRDAAQAWLNIAFDPEVQVAFAKATGYAPTHTKAAQRIGEDPLIASGFITDAKDVAGLFFPDWDQVNAAYPQWIEKWNRAMRR
jgi:putative spermidine/putrescine transport system substrate-binding protein